MDNNMQTPTGSTSRKRPREGETESQRIKREKAAERQRRKRERDRNAAVGMLAYSASAAQQQQQQPPQQQQQPPQHPQHPPPQPHQALQQPQHIPQPAQPAPTDIQQPEMSPDEIARRDRVRSAARERQRKHRRMVKERKMRELGLDMGNEMMQPMDDVHYRQPDPQYPQVIHDLQQIPPPHPPIPHEPPFPQGPPIGGQTFASTLLLSFSCAPLLKQHLLRTLNMTNEELASLEPIIAEAWDRWDHQRRIHYAEQAAKGAGAPPGPPPTLGAPSYIPLTHDEHGNPTPFGAPPPPGPPPGDPNANEFRARFHRPLIAQPPFRTYTSDAQQQQQQQPGQQQQPAPTVPANPAGANPAEAIDPHLSGGQPTAPGAAKNENRT